MDISKLHLHWRASQYKGKTYRSYSLALPYRKNGKNRKDIVVKLGKLPEEEADKWRTVLKAIKQPYAFVATAEDLIVTRRYAYLDIATVSVLWDEWKLDEAFEDKGKRELDVATIARILTINRCIDPAAKSQVPQWFNTTALKWLLDVDEGLINASRIFRELTEIESRKETICDHLFGKMRSDTPDSLNLVFYDLSSTTFSGSHCVLMRWGHCKEGYFNHIVLALVVNRDGLPFYWEVLPGATADAKTITWLIGSLKEKFKIAGATLIFDRGMVSEDNLKRLCSVKYISAMDRNQVESISGIDFSAFSYLQIGEVQKKNFTLPGFKVLNGTTLYREIKVQDERRYILCFNPQLFKDQRLARSQAIDDFKKYVKEMNEELCVAKNSRQRRATYEKFKKRLVKAQLKGFVDVRLKRTCITQKSADGRKRNVRSYAGVLKIDEAALLKAGRLDGFWMLVTNHHEKEGGRFNVTAEDVITPYREKVVIESSFRDIKSFVEVAPVYVWTEAHVKAHYTLCVLAHLINRTITLRLRQNKGDMTKDIVTHENYLTNCHIAR